MNDPIYGQPPVLGINFKESADWIKETQSNDLTPKKTARKKAIQLVVKNHGLLYVYPLVEGIFPQAIPKYLPPE